MTPLPSKSASVATLTPLMLMLTQPRQSTRALPQLVLSPLLAVRVPRWMVWPALSDWLQTERSTSKTIPSSHLTNYAARSFYAYETKNSDLNIRDKDPVAWAQFAKDLVSSSANLRWRWFKGLNVRSTRRLRPFVTFKIWGLTPCVLLG